MTSGEVVARLDATLQREGVVEVRTDLDAERRTAFAAGARRATGLALLVVVVVAGVVTLGYVLSWDDPWGGLAGAVLATGLVLLLKIAFDTFLDAPHMPLVVTVTHDGVSIGTDPRHAATTYPWSAITSVGLDRSTGTDRVVLEVEPGRAPEGVVRLPRRLEVEAEDLAAWLDVRRRLATAVD